MTERAYYSRLVLRIVPNCFLLLFVGSLDYVTGREIHLGTLYLLIVAIAGWHLRPNALVFYCLLVVVVWTAAERLSGVRFTREWIDFWNMANHLGVVTITASMVAKAKATVQRQQRLIRDLGQTLLRISQFKELVPVCRVCHELHFDEDYQARLDELINEGVDMDSIGDICPTCLAARAARLAAIPLEGYFNAPLPPAGPGAHHSANVPPDNGASPSRSAPPVAADGRTVP